MNPPGKILPLFLVGCPRSGTTLLSSILEVKFNLAVPLETHFIPYYSRLLWLWGDLKHRENREQLLDEIFIFLEIWTARNNPARRPGDCYPVSLLAVKEQRDEIVDSGTTFGAMVMKIFALYARGRGREYWLDSSSFYDVEPLHNWDGHFPGIKVIHIIRDGRDATISWLKSWFRPSNLADTSKRWLDHVTEKQLWGRRNPDSYLEIYYEDLLDSPEKVIDQIADFINESPNPGPIELEKSLYAQVLKVGGTHDLLSGGIQKGNKGKWQSGMREKEQQFFEFIAGSTLEKLNYPRRFTGFSLWQRGYFLLKKLFSWPQRFVIKNFYFRKAKTILPVMIFLAIRLGVSKEAIVKWLRSEENIQAGW
ncbi:MAG: sulfotransferase [Magnetococcales bacterium]|nr:sulfotransferase [Magnetococcales bacterium]